MAVGDMVVVDCPECEAPNRRAYIVEVTPEGGEVVTVDCIECDVRFLAGPEGKPRYLLAKQE